MTGPAPTPAPRSSRCERSEPRDAPLRTVLLDLDGVLLDQAGAARAGLDAWLGDRATAEVVAAWFRAQDDWLAAWRAGRVTWQGQRRGRLREVLPVLGEEPGSDEELDAVFERGFLAGYRRAWRAFDDAAPGIAALHEAGLATAVLTNGSEAQQHEKLDAIGLAAVVGRVFTAEGLGAAKPDPRAFLLACEHLGAEPATVLYVGDEHEVDVLGARAAGLRAVLLDRDGTAPPGETSVIRTLLDLGTFVP